MRIAVYLPLLFSVVFGLLAPVLARRLPPAQATWLISVGGVISALASGFVLALLGFTLVGQHPALASAGEWSTSALRQSNPVPPVVGGVAAAAFLVLAACSVVTAIRRGWAVRDAHQLAAGLSVHDLELAVIDDPEFHAFAVPGRPGRIVLSTALMRGLDEHQRRIVIAHERAHLRHHHHIHHSAAALAAAANPFLRSLPTAIGLATERWADEEATLHERRQDVARTLYEAARCGTHRQTPTILLNVAASHTAIRVKALLRPAPTVSKWRAIGMALVLVLPCAAVLEAALDTERLFEFAQHVMRLGGR